MKVAIVGSGISGLVVAHTLRGQADITLFEAGDYFGGHTHTVDLTLGGPTGPVTHGVDTGFLVFNKRTYPKLIQLFSDLAVTTAKSDMSFSVQVPGARAGRALEWSGASLSTVFAQRANLLNPRFLRMLHDVLLFNQLATDIAVRGTEAELMLQFPMATMIRYCHNHGLIQVSQRPQWWTVAGGARHYVEKITRGIADKRLNSPVQRITRDAQGVAVTSRGQTERFDKLVLASHADQSLALLDHPTRAEVDTLSAIRYQPNRAVLHTDSAVLPQQRRAWAAWNYERAAPAPGARQQEARVCLHYLINLLQPVPFTQPGLDVTARLQAVLANPAVHAVPALLAA